MRAVAHAPNTAPSTASIMTSLYYSVHRFSGDGDRISDSLDTLAELLRDQGFATWAFVDGGYLRGVFGFAQGFDHYEDEKSGIAKLVHRAGAWIDEHSADRFFLFLHCYDVHAPYDPPPPFDTMFEEEPYSGGFEPTWQNLKEVSQFRAKISEDELRHAIALYDGGIRYTDAVLGNFFDELEGRGLLDSTLIVVSSDHGEEFLEHGSMLHWQEYYMPNLHVPLIFVGPGIGARRIDHIVELIDVLPTVLDLLDLPAHSPAMGRSLAPAILGPGTPVEGTAYSEPFRLNLPWRTILTERYQLFYAPKDGRTRLYDTVSDPHAKIDLAQTRPAVTSELLAMLKDRRRRIAAKRRGLGSSAQKVILDRKTLDQLKALGYLEDEEAR